MKKLILIFVITIMSFGLMAQYINKIGPSVGTARDRDDVNKVIKQTNINTKGLAALGIGQDLLISNELIHLYINPATGNDRSGTGVEGNPYKTVMGAIVGAPTVGNITILHLAAGEYNWSEIGSAFRNSVNEYIVVGEVSYTGDVYTTTNSGRHFSWPQALMGGTYTFSAEYTNLTYDARIASFIRMGAGTVVVTDGN